MTEKEKLQLMLMEQIELANREIMKYKYVELSKKDKGIMSHLMMVHSRMVEGWATLNG